MNYSLRNVQKCCKTAYIIIESEEKKKIPDPSFYPDLHPKLEWSILGFLLCNFCAVLLTNQPTYKRTWVKSSWTPVSTYSLDTELSTTVPNSLHQQTELNFQDSIQKKAAVQLELDQTLLNKHLIGPWVKVNHSTTEYCRQSSSH